MAEGTAHALVLGIISAIVAGDAKAVDAMLRALVPFDPACAAEVMEAMQRGASARDRESGDSR